MIIKDRPMLNSIAFTCPKFVSDPIDINLIPKFYALAGNIGTQSAFSLGDLYKMGNTNLSRLIQTLENRKETGRTIKLY